MPYILKKSKKSMVLSYVGRPIVDSYQSVNLKPYYIDKHFRNREVIPSKELPEAYKDLDSLIDEINLFKTKVVVPNKVFTADKKGLSCLRRSPSTGLIYLSYRGKNGDKARTPNTCFLSDSSDSNYSSWVCMKTFNKSISPYSNTPVYSIGRGHPDYNKWFNYMDKEYERLTGVKVERVDNRGELSQTSERLRLIDTCQSAYCNVRPGDEKEMFCSLANSGLCKVNNKLSSLYDKEGYWICRFDEHPNGDNSEGEMINGVLNRLTADELYQAKRIIEKYVDNSLLLGDSLFNV